MPPQGVMPAFLQMAASEPLQSWSAETSPPATVAAMLRAVTASGVSRTEGAWLLPTPVVVALMSPRGTGLPARRYRATAAAACA